MHNILCNCIDIYYFNTCNKNKQNLIYKLISFFHLIKTLTLNPLFYFRNKYFFREVNFWYLNQLFGTYQTMLET